MLSPRSPIELELYANRTCDQRFIGGFLRRDVEKSTGAWRFSTMRHGRENAFGATCRYTSSADWPCFTAQRRKETVRRALISQRVP